MPFTSALLNGNVMLVTEHAYDKKYSQYFLQRDFVGKNFNRPEDDAHKHVAIWSPRYSKYKKRYMRVYKTRVNCIFEEKLLYFYRNVHTRRVRHPNVAAKCVNYPGIYLWKIFIRFVQFLSGWTCDKWGWYFVRAVPG